MEIDHNRLFVKKKKNQLFDYKFYRFFSHYAEVHRRYKPHINQEQINLPPQQLAFIYSP